MTKTVVGLFDDHKEAQQVVEKLNKSGFERNDVTMTRNANDAAEMSVLKTSGMPENDIGFYTESVRRGGTLVMVQTADDHARKAADIMAKYNMVDVDRRSAEYRTKGYGEFGISQLDEDGGVIEIVEEELQVGKREVQRGGVRVHRRVIEKPVHEEVRLREERINVERRPVDRPLSDADKDAFTEKSREFVATGEEAVVSKQARVIEEVVIDRDVAERTETIEDTVRRTDVEIDETAATRTTSPEGYVKFEDDFRTHHRTNMKDSGYTYDDYATVYRYGYNLAVDGRYGNDWKKVEPEARRRWEDRNPGTWNEFKDSIYYAWDRTRNRK